MLTLLDRIDDPARGATAEEAALLYPYLGSLVACLTTNKDFDHRNFPLARRIVRNAPLNAKNRPYLKKALLALSMTPGKEKGGELLERQDMTRFLLDTAFHRGGPEYFCALFDEIASDDNTINPDYPDIPILTLASDDAVLALIRHNPHRFIQRAFRSGDSAMIARTLRLCASYAIDINLVEALNRSGDYTPAMETLAAVISRLDETGEVGLIADMLRHYRPAYTEALFSKRFRMPANPPYKIIYQTLCALGEREAIFNDIETMPQAKIDKTLLRAQAPILLSFIAEELRDEDLMGVVLGRFNRTKNPKVYLKTLDWLHSFGLTRDYGLFHQNCSYQALHVGLRSSLPDKIKLDILLSASRRYDAVVRIPLMLLSLKVGKNSKLFYKKYSFKFLEETSLFEDYVRALLASDNKNGPEIVDMITSLITDGIEQENSPLLRHGTAVYWAYIIGDRDDNALARKVLKKISIKESLEVLIKHGHPTVPYLIVLLTRVGLQKEVFADFSLLTTALKEPFRHNIVQNVLSALRDVHGQDVVNGRVMRLLKKDRIRKFAAMGYVEAVEILLEMTDGAAKDYILSALPRKWRKLMTTDTPRHVRWQELGGSVDRWQAVSNKVPFLILNTATSPWKYKESLHRDIHLPYTKMLSMDWFRAELADEGAYRLSVLFSNRQEVERYLTLYVKRWANGSDTPLHDAVNAMKLPHQGVWDVARWRELVFRFGPAVSCYLQYAPQIENHVRRHKLPFPESVQDVRNYAALFHYKHARKNPAFAALCLEHDMPEDKFEQGLAVLSRAAKTNKLPKVFIDGADIGLDHFYMENLPAGDMRGLVIGKITNDCTYLGSTAEPCAIRGTTSADSGFYVWKHKTNGMITPEDRIIAQSWAWLGKNGTLVFDSFERLGIAYDKLLIPFLEHFTHHVLSRRTREAPTGIGLGMQGGHEGIALTFKRVAQPDTPRDGELFRDAVFQYTVPAVDHRPDNKNERVPACSLS